jgi:glycerol-3-phosphate acyltransferase PlsY
MTGTWFSHPFFLAAAAEAPVTWVGGGWWTVLLAYVIGATPFGFLAGKLKGIDIRQHGSGNIGATNVLRTLGKPVGITVLILDILKGLCPVLIARSVAGPEGTLVAIFAAIAAILGHNYTFWLGFKGGKGIATSAGAIAPLIPAPFLVAVVLWIAGFAISRYVSVASILSAVSLPVTAAILMMREGQWDLPLFVFALFLSIMATWRHRTNIQRLMKGEENRFEPGKKKPQPAPADDASA